MTMQWMKYNLNQELNLLKPNVNGDETGRVEKMCGNALQISAQDYGLNVFTLNYILGKVTSEDLVFTKAFLLNYYYFEIKNSH